MHDDHQDSTEKTVPTIPVVSAPPESRRHRSHETNKMAATSGSQPPRGKLRKLKHWLSERLTKKQLLIGGAVFVLLLGGSVALGLTHRASAPQQHKVAGQQSSKPVVYYSTLTGEIVTQAQTKLPVTGVMIENSDFARPQSGLREAGVVFEAIAEGGITRFLALYQESNPANIGPIRSARPYFLQWALGFDAPLAHVGGSPEALQDIQKWHVKNLDEFYNGAYYHRISTREAPHNMYTSLSQLRALEKTKGWTTSNFTGFARKADSPAKTPTATSIDFSISGPDFGVHYAYIPKLNSYARSEGGAPHIDATTGRQLTPHVVIAMVMPYSLEKDGYHSDYNTLGSGRAYIFQDGTVTVGVWHKSTMTSQFTFTTGDGKIIGLNAGQTWLTAVGSVGDVSYKP